MIDHRDDDIRGIVQCGLIFRDFLKYICEFYSKNIRIIIKTKEIKDYSTLDGE